MTPARIPKTPKRATLLPKPHIEPPTQSKKTFLGRTVKWLRATDDPTLVKCAKWALAFFLIVALAATVIGCFPLYCAYQERNVQLLEEKPFTPKPDPLTTIRQALLKTPLRRKTPLLVPSAPAHSPTQCRRSPQLVDVQRSIEAAGTRNAAMVRQLFEELTPETVINMVEAVHEVTFDFLSRVKDSSSYNRYVAIAALTESFYSDPVTVEGIIEFLSKLNEGLPEEEFYVFLICGYLYETLYDYTAPHTLEEKVALITSVDTKGQTRAMAAQTFFESIRIPERRDNREAIIQEASKSDFRKVNSSSLPAPLATLMQQLQELDPEMRTTFTLGIKVLISTLGEDLTDEQVDQFFNTRCKHLRDEEFYKLFALLCLSNNPSLYPHEVTKILWELPKEKIHDRVLDFGIEILKSELPRSRVVSTPEQRRRGE